MGAGLAHQVVVKSHGIVKPERKVPREYPILILPHNPLISGMTWEIDGSAIGLGPLVTSGGSTTCLPRIRD